MASIPVLLGLIVLGTLTGYVFSLIEGFLKKIKLPSIMRGIDLMQFLAEIFYFAAVLCAPLSGNLILSLILLAAFAYALYGSYGQGQLAPLKDEDKVDSKWFPKYP